MASRERTALMSDGGQTSYDSSGSGSRTGTQGSLNRMSHMIHLLQTGSGTTPQPAQSGAADQVDGAATHGKDSTRNPVLPFVGGTAAYVEELRKVKVTELCRPGTSFFPNDQLRRVDFVLVWEKDSNNSEKQVRQRRVFEAWLRRHRVQMVDCVATTDSNRHFVLLHAPRDLLLDKAEEMHVKMTVRDYDREEDHFSRKIFGVCNSDPLRCGVEETTMHVASPFSKNLWKQGRYKNSDNFERFFSIKQRCRMVHQILTETRFGDEPSDIGIEQLVESGSYMAAFPLHEGLDTPSSDWSGMQEDLSPRQLLRQYWSRWGCWYKYQPLDHVKDYFGEHIAIYFAWLGFYTAWLLPAALIGLIVFIGGVATANSDEGVREACDKSKLMCPLCSENSSKCEAWNLSTKCTLFKMEHMFDNEGSVFFAVFMALWATLFLEFWKRQTAVLSFRWNTMDFEAEEEPIRAKYALKATERRKNPITDSVEPYMPEAKRWPRYLTGFSILLAMVGMIGISIIAVMVYRTFSTKLLGAGLGATVASVSSSVIQVVIIIILSKIYEKLAVILTEWENHRTESSYQDNLTLKRFLFEFANYYSSLFYIAFFKGRWLGEPGHWALNVFKFHPEQCSAAGCMQELAQQLAIIMVGKQMINNVLEFILPLLKNFMAKRKARKEAEQQAAEAGIDVAGLIPRAEKEVIQWEEDFTLEEDEGLFGEYLEMVLQFGFITIFVAAFPLAPLFALLNNWIEIRLDAHNYVSAMRRPVPQVAQDIGVWYTILDMIVKISIICSAFIIGFTSSFIDRVFYKFNFKQDLVGITDFTNSLISGSVNGSGLGYDCWYVGHHDYYGNRTIDYWHLVAIRVAFVIVFEHVAFIVANALDLLVPDIPKSLDEKIKREAYMAQRELEEILASEKQDDSSEEEDLFRTI
eukprot:scpid20162/ scgid2817/ Anoctamin-7; Dresden transmembrane protein of the prostate; IPCA-5; New gene expressed in prostate; Prostate cancer-associated protein 5; Transmembrane protein 16G